MLSNQSFVLKIVVVIQNKTAGTLGNKNRKSCRVDARNVVSDFVLCTSVDVQSFAFFGKIAGYNIDAIKKHLCAITVLNKNPFASRPAKRLNIIIDNLNGIGVGFEMNAAIVPIALWGSFYPVFTDVQLIGIIGINPCPVCGDQIFFNKNIPGADNMY